METYRVQAVRKLCLRDLLHLSRGGRLSLSLGRSRRLHGQVRCRLEVSHVVCHRCGDGVLDGLGLQKFE